jgi:flagellar biosynthetic protein FliR
MPLEISADVIGQWIGGHVWPLFRVASFLMVMPVIGTNLVPARVRMGLALLVTILIVPLIGPVPQVDPLSATAVQITLQQILIGTAMAFAVVMLLQVFVVAGQFIAMQMGLGFASMVDPSNGVQVTVMSQFYLVAVTLVFLALNGHLVVIESLVESFRVMPIAVDGLSLNSIWALVNRISWLFAAAMLVALPAVTAVLIVYLSFGIMTRAAPQLNIFAIGFPISLLFGLIATWVVLGGLAPKFQALSENTFLFLRQLQVGP